MVAIDEIYSCGLDRMWLWTHGHIDRSKFKGQILSNHDNFDADVEVEDIINAKVVYGWVFTVTGDLSGCGWDMTTYFEKEMPSIIEGQWETDDIDGNEVFAEVVDGPHEATWLEIK